MRISQETNQELEIFFRKYFNDENLKLPKIQVYAGRSAGFITWVLGIHGITLGRHIFIKPNQTGYDKEKRLTISKNLLSHEVAHVVQYQKMGFFGFLYKYLKDYFLLLRTRRKWNAFARMEAYWEIPHEVEARDAAASFIEWTRGK